MSAYECASERLDALLELDLMLDAPGVCVADVRSRLAPIEASLNLPGSENAHLGRHELRRLKARLFAIENPACGQIIADGIAMAKLEGHR